MKKFADRSRRYPSRRPGATSQKSKTPTVSGWRFSFLPNFRRRLLESLEEEWVTDSNLGSALRERELPTGHAAEDTPFNHF